MMKRLFAAAAAGMVLFFSILPAAAEDGLPRVIDGADILTQEEEDRLEEVISGFQEEHGTDLVILTEEDAAVSDPELHAQDYYDLHGYGMGEERSGLILYVNMSTRDVAGCASGETKYLLSNQRLDYVIDAGFDDLAAGNYADSFQAMIREANRQISRGIDPNAGDRGHTYTPVYEQERSYPIMFLVVGAVVGAIGGGVLYLTVSKQYAAVSRDAIYNTRGNTRLDLTRDQDILVDTLLTSRVIQDPPSSSGGGRSSSRFRSSSSGRSFSRSSRKF